MTSDTSGLDYPFNLLFSSLKKERERRILKQWYIFRHRYSAKLNVNGGVYGDSWYLVLHTHLKSDYFGMMGSCANVIYFVVVSYAITLTVTRAILKCVCFVFSQYTVCTHKLDVCTCREFGHVGEVDGG